MQLLASQSHIMLGCTTGRVAGSLFFTQTFFYIFSSFLRYFRFKLNEDALFVQYVQSHDRKLLDHSR